MVIVLLIGTSRVCTCMQCVVVEIWLGKIEPAILSLLSVTHSLFLVTSSSSLIVALMAFFLLKFPVTVLKSIMILWLYGCCLDSISNVSGISIKVIKHHVIMLTRRCNQVGLWWYHIYTLACRYQKFAWEYQKVEKSDFLWPWQRLAWFAALQWIAGLGYGNEAMLWHLST